MTDVWAIICSITIIIIIILIGIIIWILYTNKSKPLIMSSFTFSPLAPIYTNTKITFINTSKNAKKYYWLFGDDTLSNDVNPEHIYTKANTYEIILIAIDDNQCAYSTQKITVLEALT